MGRKGVREVGVRLGIWWGVVWQTELGVEQVSRIVEG